jgi:NAD(P)-dependent dehydrogenase (short-subunit alcohol dehydrogenase family)
MGGLDGKVAIVTGAGGGFGESYTRCLTAEGAAVVMSDIQTEHVEEAAARIAADGGSVVPVTADVTDPDSWAEVVRAGTERFGGIDILVNNAGLMSEIPMDIPFAKLPLEWWDRVLCVNLTGPFLGIQAVVPEMKQRGGGRIVNQSSGGAFGPSGVYGVSKLGLVSLTVSMAHELARFKITVNAIAPGFTNTPAALRSLPEGMEDMAEQIAPLGGGTADDVHGALLLLTGDAGRWITGQTLNVDGGWVMRI